MTEESLRVQNFIDVHRNLVLRDALRDLENCKPEEISTLLHRLKGTLGTFQFSELAEVLKNLLLITKNEKSSDQLADSKRTAIDAIERELHIKENRE